MDNVLIDDRRIHVDFSQSVAKLWTRFRKFGSKDTNDQGSHLTWVLELFLRLFSINSCLHGFAQNYSRSMRISTDFNVLSEMMIFQVRMPHRKVKEVVVSIVENLVIRRRIVPTDLMEPKVLRRMESQNIR